jgi:Nitronate monooxygenase
MLKTPLCDVFGIDVPIILAPMGTCTSAEFAAAVSNEGGLGGIGSPFAQRLGARAGKRLSGSFGTGEVEKSVPESAGAVGGLLRARSVECPNGALRVKMHDKHGPLVSIGKHLGMFVDRLQIQERKQISAEPMSAEEWKRQFVREG